jgi:hypothetical protein
MDLELLGRAAAAAAGRPTGSLLDRRAVAHSGWGALELARATLEKGPR